MDIDLLFVLTLLAALGCGAIGGTFFAFSVFVMKALGRLPPAQGIAAMQSINIVVINPWFLTAFLGTAAASLALAGTALLLWQEPEAVWLMAGAVLYLAGNIAVTFIGNIPLNDALAAVAPAGAESAALWARYLDRWTAWNHVRTITALAAAASFMLALR